MNEKINKKDEPFIFEPEQALKDCKKILRTTFAEQKNKWFCGSIKSKKQIQRFFNY